MSLKPETIERYSATATSIGAHFVKQTARQKVLLKLDCGHEKEINASHLVQRPDTIRCRACAAAKRIEWHKAEIERLEKEMSISC